MWVARGSCGGLACGRSVMPRLAPRAVPCPSPLKIGTCRVTSAQKHMGCLGEGDARCWTLEWPWIETLDLVERFLPGQMPFSRRRRHIGGTSITLSELRACPTSARYGLIRVGASRAERDAKTRDSIHERRDDVDPQVQVDDQMPLSSTWFKTALTDYIPFV